jgi:hypothetical protein
VALTLGQRLVSFFLSSRVLTLHMQILANFGYLDKLQTRVTVYHDPFLVSVIVSWS